MQIVIDIPEHIKILTEKYHCYGKQAEKIIWNAIKDGTPLSECQAEDCIDRDMAIKEINKVFADYIPLLIGKYEEIPLKCGKAIKNMPSVYPKSDNSENVTLTFSKGTLKFSCKDYVVYKKDWFRSHYGAEIDIMCGDKQYLSDNSVLEDIKAEIEPQKSEGEDGTDSKQKGGNR